MDRIDVEVSEGRILSARLEGSAPDGDLVLSVEPANDGRGWRSLGGTITVLASALPEVRRALERLEAVR